MKGNEADKARAGLARLMPYAKIDRCDRTFWRTSTPRQAQLRFLRWRCNPPAQLLSRRLFLEVTKRPAGMGGKAGAENHAGVGQIIIRHHTFAHQLTGARQ